MTQHANPPVTPSAAAHAERIRAGEEERTADSGTRRDGRQTFELYAERARAQALADEELREAAALRELQARGIISADEELVDEADDEGELEGEDVDEGEGEPLSTAERYAAVELRRREAERKANVAAQTGAVQTIGQPVGHRHAAPQPHRYAHLWQKPAS